MQKTRLHEFLLHKVIEPAENKDFQTLLASFRASGGMLKKQAKSKIWKKINIETHGYYINYNSFLMKFYRLSVETIERKPQKQPEQSNVSDEVQLKDALDIANHQALPLLFTYLYYSPDGTSSSCVHPRPLNISFYGDNDIMLGQFLERYCFDNTYVCNACKLPILGHIRRYVEILNLIRFTANFVKYNIYFETDMYIPWAVLQLN